LLDNLRQLIRVFVATVILAIELAEMPRAPLSTAYDASGQQ
jgi:hypothetical protein